MTTEFKNVSGFTLPVPDVKSSFPFLEKEMQGFTIDGVSPVKIEDAAPNGIYYGRPLKGGVITYRGYVENGIFKEANLREKVFKKDGGQEKS